MYGEYSEMTPYIEQTLDSFDAAILSSASINGNMRNSFLIKKVQLTQSSNLLPDPNQPKQPGFLDGLGGLFGKKKQQDNGGGMLGR